MDTFHETKYYIWAALGRLGSLKFIYQGALLFENLKLGCGSHFRNPACFKILKESMLLLQKPTISNLKTLTQLSYDTLKMIVCSSNKKADGKKFKTLHMPVKIQQIMLFCGKWTWRPQIVPRPQPSGSRHLIFRLVLNNI